MKGKFRKRYSYFFSLASTHLEKADESSYLISIILSVLAAFAILGTGVALLFLLVYRPRKKGMTFPSYRHHSINVHRHAIA